LTSLFIRVFDTGELFFGQGNQLGLLKRGQVLDLLNLSLDGVDDQGEEGVGGVVHVALAETVDGGVEHSLLDGFLVAAVEGLVELGDGFVQDALEDPVAVLLLVGLGLLEDVDGSLVDLLVESVILVSQEIVDTFSLDLLETGVNIDVLKLTLRDSDHILHLS